MITIIDYGLGNIGSVVNALTTLGADCRVSGDPAVIRQSTALLLPGVGAAGAGMTNLRSRGLDTAIRQAVSSGVPFLGVCLGLQLLFDYSEENDTPCLGIIPGTVRRFRTAPKVPQIGWNTVAVNRGNPEALRLFAGLSDTAFYFVNSYYPVPKEPRVIAAMTEYGETFASAVVTRNVFATQFHPEKSGAAGIQVLKNFIKGVL